MSRGTDYVLSFHRPRGMSCSHYRAVIRNRLYQYNNFPVHCGKPMGSDSWCMRAKGHFGECDDIPF